MDNSITTNDIVSLPLRALFVRCPYAADLLASVKIDVPDEDMTLAELLGAVPDEYLQDFSLTRAGLAQNIAAYLEQTEAVAKGAGLEVRTVTVLGGHDKDGKAEDCTLTLARGDIVCIVGPTGAGKSRLLADIECMAQRDTPTGRQVLVNGAPPADTFRFDIEHKLVAQLSQNMNFVMDLSVAEFVTLHAQSRMVPDEAKAVRDILACANDLAGEPFGGETPLTQLSGGQSRALMIASTALLSRSPIVLIDEIENAGIDRQKAVRLLARREKIVLMSTHDPILALLGGRRVVVKNGGVAAIVHTGEAERANLAVLERIDAGLSELRARIRRGESIGGDLSGLFPPVG